MAAPRIVVIGAGILGASIAWHLARAGARVTVVEKGIRGGIATRASWAWINASWGNPEPYFRLRARAMDDWRRWAVPGLAPRWPGGLLWDLERQALERYAAEHGAWGYGVRLVDRAEAARIEPGLARLPDRAVHVAGEGAVDALAAALALLADAGRRGARIVEGTAARGLLIDGGRARGIATGDGRIAADAVVVAAGEATPGLLAGTGAVLPLDAPPGLLVVTRPAPPLLNGLVMAPELHVRQDASGRLIAGADFGGTDPGDDPEATAREVFAALQALLKDGGALAFERHTVGRRPTPADGLPAVGGVPGVDGLFAAVTHSGVTLAPALGRMLAGEVLHGRRDPLLAPFGLDRFETGRVSAG